MKLPKYAFETTLEFCQVYELSLFPHFLFIKLGSNYHIELSSMK